MRVDVEFVNRLVYLDKAFVSNQYELATQRSPQTLISMNQGKKAGASLSVFSAEISAQEVRSFPLSTLAMLKESLPFILDADLSAADSSVVLECSTQGWVNGFLSCLRATGHPDQKGQATSTAHFLLRAQAGTTYLLITTPEYFASGFDALLKMQETILKSLRIPVRAHLRVLAGNSHLDQPLAIPSLMFENVDAMR